jgi:hypothetical protein
MFEGNRLPVLKKEEKAHFNGVFDVLGQEYPLS